MSKAFTKEDSDAPDDDEDIVLPPLPAGTKNYMTPGGHGRLKAELDHLTSVERPEVTRIVSWAASNGDRSENGDYLYGKRRLRE
ncbi:MAG TPA: transcription elongation factor GreB, partial [Casimicrobium huifangae]|nr:transcription elongation factor GreB [Casimicrobium huifangae]